MDNINDILQGPEYFDCEKTRCKLRIDVCLGRQKANENQNRFGTLPYGECEKCSQGIENKRFYKSKDSIKGKPRRGKGQREESCKSYSDCLDIVAKKGWKSFNCESCPQYKPEMKEDDNISEKKQNTRVCESEGCEKTTLNANCPLCPSCMARKANKSRADKKSSHKKRKHKDGSTLKKKETTRRHKDRRAKPKGKTNDKPNTEKTSPDSITALTIEFGEHASILREVEKLAEEEMRPVDLQVIYMVKKYLETMDKLDTHRG